MTVTFFHGQLYEKANISAPIFSQLSQLILDETEYAATACQCVVPHAKCASHDL